MEHYIIYETEKDSLSHKGLRFIIINKSITGHCCFEASVIDTKQGLYHNPPDYYCWSDGCYMGEMFDIDTAIKVCVALNKSTN